MSSYPFGVWVRLEAMSSDHRVTGGVQHGHVGSSSWGNKETHKITMHAHTCTQSHLIGQWGEVWVLGEDLRMHRENMQNACRKIKLRTFLLKSNSVLLQKKYLLIKYSSSGTKNVIVTSKVLKVLFIILIWVCRCLSLIGGAGRTARH